jgi:outer membrane protein assembly factor BamB
MTATNTTRGRRAQVRLRAEPLEGRDCPAAAAPASWGMYGHDVLGSRDNTQEHVLTAKNVGTLGMKWAFNGFSYGAPAVVGGVVYATDGGGVVALDEKTGAVKWNFTGSGFASDSPLVTQGVVVFGDFNGDVWGLDAATGVKKWQVHPNTQGGPRVAVYGSAIPVGNDVVIGMASNEEQQGVSTFSQNGSAIMLDAQTGNLVWQAYMIPDADYQAGWRGASVWSTPTYDAATNTVYVTTGNYFQAGTTTDPGVEDAVRALDATTGTLQWTNQLVKNDVWNGTIVPGPNNPDADIGDSPKIITLPDGTKAIGVGSKDGFYFEMDAATGAALNGPNALQLEVGGVEGGLFATGAVDQKDGAEFSNGNDWPTLLQPNDPGPVGGDLYAVSLDGKTMRWDFKTPSPALSGVAVANGIVYFKTLDGTLYFLNARAKDAAHALIGTLAVGNGYAAPVVVDGMLFAAGNSGIEAFGFTPKAAGSARGHGAAAGAGLLSAEVTLASGGLTKGQVNAAARAWSGPITVAVKDLATLIGVKAPSTAAFAADFKAYATAVNAGDANGAQAALTNVKADLTALFAALANPMADPTTVQNDETTLFGTLDTLLADQQAHNLSAASTDAATAFGNLMTVFNDLLGGRYGVAH